jgi:hypothetical protein
MGAGGQTMDKAGVVGTEYVSSSMRREEIRLVGPALQLVFFSRFHCQLGLVQLSCLPARGLWPKIKSR